MLELITVDDSDLKNIEGERERTFRAIYEPLTAKVILDDIQRHQRKRVIVICNTVSKSQGLYRDLRQLVPENQLKITLLHARFKPEDRAKKESSLEQLFGKKWKEKNDGICQVLISTQVIEAGINITCEVMHTQLAPMNSLLQRAGRCARFRDEQGKVFIYKSIEITQDNSELSEKDFDTEVKSFLKKKESFNPYSENICEETWKFLETHSQSEQVNQKVDFNQEKDWINKVHTEEDLLQHQRREDNRGNFNTNFHAAVFRGELYAARELIRDIDSRNIFITQDPDSSKNISDEEEININNLEAFSISPSTLYKVFNEVQKQDYPKGWLFGRIESPPDSKAENYNQLIVKQIKDSKELAYSFRILVNRSYVRYNDKIGLVIALDADKWIEDTKSKQTASNNHDKKGRNEYKYHMDTYVGHLGCMWTCWRKPLIKEVNGKLVKYASVRDELLQAGGRFIKTKIFSERNRDDEAWVAETEALFEYLVFLAIFTHDIGKLQKQWQKAIRNWQKFVYEEFKGKDERYNPKSHLLAHTDYDPESEEKDSKGRTQKKAQKDYKRPPHAIESAFIAQGILKQSLIPTLSEHFNADEEQLKWICWTVIMAAARHHSAWADGWTGANLPKSGKIELHDDAQQAIADSWDRISRLLPKTLPLPDKPNLKQPPVYTVKTFKLAQFEPDQIQYLQLYWLVARALRLCDQRSVEKIEPHHNTSKDDTQGEKT